MSKRGAGVENYALDAPLQAAHGESESTTGSMPVSIKVVVLYPQPIDQEAFEQAYHGQHMPLMWRLITPAERVPTFRVKLPADAPFYRMAEIHFDSITELEAFANSEGGKAARRSS